MSNFKPQPKHWAFVGIVSVVVFGFAGFISFAELTNKQFIWATLLGFFIFSFVPLIARICFVKDLDDLG